MAKIKPEYTQAGTRYDHVYYTYITFQCLQSVHTKPEIQTLHTNYSSRNEQYESIPQDSRAVF